MRPLPPPLCSVATPALNGESPCAGERQQPGATVERDGARRQGYKRLQDLPTERSGPNTSVQKIERSVGVEVLT